MSTARKTIVARLRRLAGSLGLALAAAANGARTAPAQAREAVGSEPEGLGAWVEDVAPSYFVDIQLLDISLWQWVALAILICVASLVGFQLARLLFGLCYSLAARSAAAWDDELLARTVAPLRLAASVAIFYFGTLLLSLSERGEATMIVLCKVLIVVAAVWLAMRLVDVFAVHIDRVLERKGEVGGKSLVPIGRRVTKAFLLVLAALSLLQNLGFNVASLLAGLGIGGLAIALAAQKTLENVFGGFMLVADRPVRLGDFCRVGEHMGTVEDIGMRSSRLRTIDRTLLTIPNAEFSTARIENFGVRDRIRLALTLQVGYDTSPDQMRYLLVELRRMLYAHPKTLPDPCRVRFVNFGAHSLDIEIFVFIDTRDFAEFTGIREDIFLRIMDIIADSGAYFAYPSQTLYLGRDGGRNIENSERAEAQVKAWRQDNAMPIPEFPPALVAEIDDTLEYPPRGSASRAAAAT